jgi:hypothetical protein
VSTTCRLIRRRASLAMLLLMLLRSDAPPHIEATIGSEFVLTYKIASTHSTGTNTLHEDSHCVFRRLDSNEDLDWFRDSTRFARPKEIW